VVIEFEDDTGSVRRVESEVEEGRPWSQSRNGDPHTRDPASPR